MDAARFRIELEMQERGKKYIKINRNYKNPPNPKFITEKFYSKYDRMGSNTSAEYEALLQRNLAEIYNSSNRTPKEKSSLPVTENQVYGWLWEKRFVYDAMDCELFCRNRMTDELMRTEFEVSSQLSKFKNM